jgi:hypothetical protein
VAQGVKQLLYKCEALSSKPSPIYTKKKNGEIKILSDK